MEFTEVGLYLFFPCVFATLFQHPVSPIRDLVPNGTVRAHRSASRLAQLLSTSF